MVSQEEVAYLKKAYEFASYRSDDPRTQNGAILVKHDIVIGIGVNELPRKVEKTEERLNNRDIKYKFMEHAERNAIFAAAREGYNTEYSTLFVPWYACADCARSIIQAGIKRVVGHKQVFDAYGEGPWTESINAGNEMFKEAGVITELYDGQIGGVQIMLNGKIWKP